MMDEVAAPFFRFNFAAASSPLLAQEEEEEEEAQKSFDKHNSLLGRDEEGALAPAPPPREIFPHERCEVGAGTFTCRLSVSRVRPLRLVITSEKKERLKEFGGYVTFKYSLEVEVFKPFTTDPVVFQGGFTLVKGRVSTSDIFGVARSDLVPGIYEGGLKLWECTIDLVNTLRREIKDGQLSFRGKRVLELGCGHGLPGILACIKGASTVHFQDFNAEVLRNLTIPNVQANLQQEQARNKLGSSPNKLGGGLLSKSGQVNPDAHYYAGDWGDVYELLSTVGDADNSDSSGEEDSARVSISGNAEQDNGPCNQGVGEYNFGARALTSRSRRLSRSSRACERGSDEAALEGGYDIIMMSETVYSVSSLPKLYELIKKCLKPPYGALYVAGKKHYFGVGGGTRVFKSLVEEDGVLGAHLVTDFADGSSNVREIWKFFYRS